jgi:hypothetical protein
MVVLLRQFLGPNDAFLCFDGQFVKTHRFSVHPSRLQIWQSKRPTKRA